MPNGLTLVFFKNLPKNLTKQIQYTKYMYIKTFVMCWSSGMPATNSGMDSPEYGRPIWPGGPHENALCNVMFTIFKKICYCGLHVIAIYKEVAVSLHNSKGT